MAAAASKTKQRQHLEEVRKEGDKEQGSGSRELSLDFSQGGSEGTEFGQGGAASSRTLSRTPRPHQANTFIHVPRQAARALSGDPCLQCPASTSSSRRCQEGPSGVRSSDWLGHTAAQESHTTASISPQTATHLSQRLMFRTLAGGKGDAKNAWDKMCR